MRRTRRDIQVLTELVADENKQAVASIYCMAQADDSSRCSRRVASLYRIGRTYIVADYCHYTFPEARTAHLNTALAAKEAGPDYDWIAAVQIAAADVKVWGPQATTLDPRGKDDPLYGGAGPYPLPFDHLLIGCRHHGNALFSYGYLINAAKNGGHAEVDLQASELVVLPSEMPAEG